MFVVNMVNRNVAECIGECLTWLLPEQAMACSGVSRRTIKECIRRVDPMACVKFVADSGSNLQHVSIFYDGDGIHRVLEQKFFDALKELIARP